MLKTFEAGLNKVETILVCAGLLVLIFTVFAAAVLRFFGVDMLITKFHPAVLNGIYLFNYILILFFLLFAVRYGIDLCIVNAARKYQTLYISYSFATASCPVGCGLMCITAVKHIVQYIRNIIRHDYSSLAREEAAA